MVDFMVGQFTTATIYLLGVVLLPGDVTDTDVITFSLGYGVTAFLVMLLEGRKA